MTCITAYIHIAPICARKLTQYIQKEHQKTKNKGIRRRESRLNLKKAYNKSRYEKIL